MVKYYNYNHFTAGLSWRAAAKEINDVQDPPAVNEHMIQNWFRRLKEDDTSFKENPRSGRPSAV